MEQVGMDEVVEIRDVDVVLKVKKEFTREGFGEGHLCSEKEQPEKVCILRVTRARYNWLKEYGFIEIYRKARLLEGSHILRVLSTYVDKDHAYICVPECITLEEFILKKREKEETMSSEIIQKILMDIVMGLQELHDKDFVHGDLTPAKIFVVEGKEKRPTAYVFCILGKADERTKCWRARELINNKNYPRNKKSDMFNLGLVFNFCLSGDNLFGHAGQTEDAIRMGMPADLRTMKNLSYEMSTILNVLLTHDVGKRNTCQWVLEHPYFWEPEKRVRFLCAAHEWLKTELADVTVFNQRYALPYTWSDKLDIEILDRVNRSDTRLGRNSGKRPSDLLRFIRNTYAHFYEVAIDVPKMQDNWANAMQMEVLYMQQTFPEFLMHVYSFTLNTRPHSRYQKQDFF